MIAPLHQNAALAGHPPHLHPRPRRAKTTGRAERASQTRRRERAYGLAQAFLAPETPSRSVGLTGSTLQGHILRQPPVPLPEPNDQVRTHNWRLQSERCLQDARPEEPAGSAASACRAVVLAFHVHLAHAVFGLALVYQTFTLPFTIWMMRAFFADVPFALYEAARLQGAKSWQILLRS